MLSLILANILWRWCHIYIAIPDGWGSYFLWTWHGWKVQTLQWVCLVHYRDNEYLEWFLFNIPLLHMCQSSSMPNDFHDYLHHNVDVRIQTSGWDWQLYHLWLVMWPKDSKLKCKVCHFVPIYIVVCNARIVYIHFTNLGISRACILIGSMPTYVKWHMSWVFGPRIPTFC